MNNYSSIIINLNNISKNYISLKKRVGTKTELASVLKADAYGLGTNAIAKTLFKLGCCQFFVAYSNEALELKNTLSPNHNKTNIYVFNGPYLKGWTEFFHDHNFIPVINVLDDLMTWHEYARSKERILPAILHLETGMNRLALTHQDIQQYTKQQWPWINIKYIMSHLACADNSMHPMNGEQLEVLKQFSKLFPNTPSSLSNSSGIFLGPPYHLNMVRPGMSIFGLNPTPYQNNPMYPCVKVQARILQIKNVPSQQGLGYSKSIILKQTKRIGTIALGYADGVPWNIDTQKAEVILNSKRAPIIGRISMDLVNIDLTNIPQANIGDWVEVVNEEITIDDIARQCHTVSYQVLTNLGKRFKKVYTCNTVNENMEPVHDY